MRAKILLLIAVGVVLGTTLNVARTTPNVAHAQQPGLRADIAGVSGGVYPAARVIVNIDDTTASSGALTAANFTAAIDGKPATVLSADLASSQDAPLDLLLLIDVSGSMAGEAMAQTKTAAKGLVETLDPNDRVAIMTFADTVKLAQDYTTDRARTATVIDGLAAKGNTALYDATGSAAYKAGQSTASRRAVIVLSDGAQDGVKLKTTRVDALAAAGGIGVPFFVIGEGKTLDRDYLNQLASSTKGRYLEAPKASDLTGLFASIGRLLTSQFIVSIDAGTAAGLAEAAVTITVQSSGASVTAQGTFRPGPDFSPPPIGITLTGVTEGESLAEPRVVTAVPDSAAGIARVAFYVDDVNVYETADAPYSFNYDPRDFSDATHTIKAAAIVGAKSFESAPLSFASHPPVAPAKSGGGLPLLPIAAGVVGLIILLVLVRMITVVMGRLRAGGGVKVVSPEQRITPWVARHRSLSEADANAEAVPIIITEDVGEPMGVLISRAGPLVGTEYVVGGKPVGIGSGARCGVRIADVSVGAEEARIWVRDGHLMLHRVTRLTDVAADGSSGGWTILQPGDILDIGDHKFEFRLWAPPEPQPEAAPDEPVPNILRDAAAPRSQRPLASPAPSNAGALWPRDDVSRSTASDAADVDAQAS